MVSSRSSVTGSGVPLEPKKENSSINCASEMIESIEAAEMSFCFEANMSMIAL